nr:two-component response regulator-like APRR5 isoform X1 [Quercus suber]POE53983.1 two-component response regulator-like aprr5 [Quercus suber]
MQKKDGPWERFLWRIAHRVLLIKADDSTRQIIPALLWKCSYEVAAVSDALKAWETLKGRPHNIDLELTEVELPSIFGFALLTLVMEHVWRRQTLTDGCVRQKLIAPHQKVEGTSQNNAARNHSNDCVASMQKNIKCSEKGSHPQ